jgi:SAM-dependent methyltransferase
VKRTVAVDAAARAAAPRIFTPEYYKRMRDLEAASWWNAGMRDVAALLLHLAALPESGVVLDVGCGSGQTIGWFTAARPNWRAVGLDVSSEGLLASRALGITAVMRASALELPVRDGAVDLVITLDVLQHLPLDGGDRRALHEINRVLKPGGYLFLRTNAQTFPHTPDDPVFAFHKYGRQELRAKLTDAGLTPLRVGRVNAVLGLAEIPRELKAKAQPHSYHGLLAEPSAQVRWSASLKRKWLRVEGRAVQTGLSWPGGRTLVALCRKDL